MIKPLNDYVLVRLETPRERIVDGVVVPAPKACRGIVVAIGPRVDARDIAPGDCVMLPPGSFKGTPVTCGGVMHYLVHAPELPAVTGL